MMLSRTDGETYEEAQFSEFRSVDIGNPTLNSSLNMVIHGYPDNRVLLHNSIERMPHLCGFKFLGRNNLAVVGPDTNWEGSVCFDGDNGEARLLGETVVLNVVGTVYGGGKLVWGKRSNAYGVRFFAHGGRTIQVSDDCLFSESIEIRTSDHHSIIDLATGKAINEAADVSIGRHVWIGPGVSINKGVSIGDGSIVGAKALVVSDIPDRQLWAGVPARVLRSNVSWVGSHPAIKEHIQRLAEMGIVSD